MLDTTAQGMTPLVESCRHALLNGTGLEATTSRASISPRRSEIVPGSCSGSLPAAVETATICDG